jgi:hypothetical protein
MAKNDFPKVTPADSYPLGHAKENKDASAYTGFKYPAGGGDDIGVYKQPMINPNGTEKAAVTKSGSWTNETNISVAAGSKGNYTPENKYGEKTMRGYGAATKGIKTRGPMA